MWEEEVECFLGGTEYENGIFFVQVPTHGKVIWLLAINSVNKLFIGSTCEQ